MLTFPEGLFRFGQLGELDREDGTPLCRSVDVGRRESDRCRKLSVSCDKFGDGCTDLQCDKVMYPTLRLRLGDGQQATRSALEVGVLRLTTSCCSREAMSSRSISAAS